MSDVSTNQVTIESLKSFDHLAPGLSQCSAINLSHRDDARECSRYKCFIGAIDISEGEVLLEDGNTLFSAYLNDIAARNSA